METQTQRKLIFGIGGAHKSLPVLANTMTEYVSSYYNEEGKYQAEFEDLCDEYLPDDGPTTTIKSLFGNALYSVLAICRDYYVNGGGNVVEITEEDSRMDDYYKDQLLHLDKYLGGDYAKRLIDFMEYAVWQDQFINKGPGKYPGEKIFDEIINKLIEKKLR